MKTILYVRMKWLGEACSYMIQMFRVNQRYSGKNIFPKFGKTSVAESIFRGLQLETWGLFLRCFPEFLEVLFLRTPLELPLNTKFKVLSSHSKQI